MFAPLSPTHRLAIMSHAGGYGSMPRLRINRRRDSTQLSRQGLPDYALVQNADRRVKLDHLPVAVLFVEHGGEAERNLSPIPQPPKPRPDR